MISGEICAFGILIGYVLWFIWIARELGKAPIEDDSQETETEKNDNNRKEQKEEGYESKNSKEDS